MPEVPHLSPSVRPAATVCAVRDGVDGVEVLMVRRDRGAAFMGDFYVFPGGAVDPEDGGPLAREAVRSGEAGHDPFIAAALRELAEEAGIFVTDPAANLTDRSDIYAAVMRAGVVLDATQVSYFANWVTPAGQERRFDTRFYAVEVPSDVVPSADRREVHDARFVGVGEALAAAQAGEMAVAMPTVHELGHLNGFARASDIVDHGRSLSVVETVRPRVVREPNGELTFLLPGDDGYEVSG